MTENTQANDIRTQAQQLLDAMTSTLGALAQLVRQVEPSECTELRLAHLRTLADELEDIEWRFDPPDREKE